MPTTKKKSVTKKVAKTASKKAGTKQSTTKKTAATKKKATPKKTAAKHAVKKSAKSAPKKTSASKPLVYADDERSFWVSNGEILNSLLALRDALSVMDTAAYTVHVTSDKNDFATWVDEVLCDGDCASALRSAKTPKSARTVVVRHLKYYEV
jgi:hypothetical protein